MHPHPKPLGGTLVRAAPARGSRTLVTGATLLCLAMLLPGAALAQGAPADTCRDKLIQASDAKGLGLNTLLDAIGPKAAATALEKGQCAVADMGLAEVIEAAVRAHDSDLKPGPSLHSLYLSPSQRVEIKAVDGGVPEDEIFSVVVAAAPWWAPTGDTSWDGLLRDINARTHHLEAQLAILDDATLARRAPGAQLSVSLLSTAVYIDLAKNKHPAVWSRLTSSPAHIDAVRLLWERAEAALAKLHARRPTPTAVMAAAHARIPAMNALYAAAAVKAPVYTANLSAVSKQDDPPDAGSAAAINADAAAATPTPVAAADAGAKSTDAGAMKVAVTQPDAGPTPAQPVVPTTPDGADAGTPDKATAPAKEPHTEVQEDSYTGWIALGIALALPWLWMGVLWLLRRRKDQRAYLSLGNRTLAIATLILVFECLGAAAVLRPSNLELLANRWALLLLWPIYMFAVLIFMLARMDKDDRLAARKLMKKWGKWGGALLIVLAVVNSIVLAFFSTIASFFLFPSLGIVGLLGVTFLVKLWRTGDLPEGAAGPAADGAEGGDAQPGDGPDEPSDNPAPKKPAPEKPAPEKPAPKAQSPPPEAAPATAAQAPERELIEDAPAAPEDDGADNPASAMSDDDLIAALEAMDAGSSSAGDAEVPADRAELYKLLDD
jgi:hypothetical protein